MLILPGAIDSKCNRSSRSASSVLSITTVGDIISQPNTVGCKEFVCKHCRAVYHLPLYLFSRSCVVWQQPLSFRRFSQHSHNGKTCSDPRMFWKSRIMERLARCSLKCQLRHFFVALRQHRQFSGPWRLSLEYVASKPKCCVCVQFRGLLRLWHVARDDWQAVQHYHRSAP